MIGTELTKGQGLGNQLFCYITTRCIAKDHGYDFTILGKDTMANNIHSDCGLYFMDLDYGCDASKESFSSEYHEKEDRLFIANSVSDVNNGVYVTGADLDLLNIEDGTLLYGNMQDEKYFISHLEEIKEWLKVKTEYDCHEYSREHLCIIHLRCSDYMDSPELYLRKKYWIDGMKHMKTIDPEMEFMIITNDVKEAGKILPGIEAHNFDLAKDYSIIKNAQYLLLANSSFSYFPAITSDTVKYILAPKYWARHNVSNGYWASEQNIYSKFHYMDRKGKVFTAGECREELEKYKEDLAARHRLNVKPDGITKKMMSLEVGCRYQFYRVNRILRGIKRRILGK